jgi:hypothetical protein
VARAHERREVGEPGDLRQDLRATDGVPTDDCALAAVERSGEVEDRGRHRELADVVEDRDELELEHLVRGQLQLVTDRAAVDREAVGVLGRPDVVVAQRVDQLGDRLLDRLASVRLRRGSDGGAPQERGELWRARIGHERGVLPG